MSNRDVILVGVQALILIVAGLGGYYGFVLRLERRLGIIEQRCIHHQEIIDRMGNLNDEVQKLKTESTMFWKVIEPHLGQIIHSPIHKTRDELVDRLIKNQLTEDDTMELIGHLRRALDNEDWPNDKRMAAALLLARTISLINGTREEDT
jgi:hypothetical protein